MLKNLSV